jgi:hypothetical protein
MSGLLMGSKHFVSVQSPVGLKLISVLALDSGMQLKSQLNIPAPVRPWPG